MQQPTVYLVIDGSAIAFDERGEVVETVEWDDCRGGGDGRPYWHDATICDHRGAGGQPGYRALVNALEQAEFNAQMCGYDIERVPAP